MAFSCDVVLYFFHQPSKQVYIGPDRKARDEQHAVELAKLDAGSKGWDLRKLNEVVIIGGVYE